jgi:hypothetical protein
MSEFFFGQKLFELSVSRGPSAPLQHPHCKPGQLIVALPVEGPAKFVRKFVRSFVLIRHTYSGVYCVKFNVGTVCNPETKKESQAKEAS